MNPSFDFDEVDFFTIGTVGEPGRRLFLLQAASGRSVATLKVEKQQVSALCIYLGQLLADLPRPGHTPEDLDLRPPLEVDFVAGVISAQYDEQADRLIITVIEAGSTTFDPEELGTEEEPLTPAAETAIAMFRVTREQAAAASIRGTSLVEAGRPPCPLCGYPIDPEGHACPRTNGNRPPTL